jgi:hypothetical protein
MSTRIEFTKGLVGKDYFKAEVLSEEEQLKLPIEILCRKGPWDGFYYRCTLIPQIPVADASLLTKMVRVNFFNIPKPYALGSTHMDFNIHFTAENSDNQRNVRMRVRIKSPKLSTWYYNAADYVCIQFEKECAVEISKFCNRPNNDYELVTCTQIEIEHAYHFGI